MRVQLAADEAVVARLRPHPRALLAPAAVLVLVAGASVYVWGVAPERWMSNAAAGLGVVFVVWGSVLPTVRWASVRYVLTTRRLIVRRGVFGRRDAHAPWSRLLTVTLSRSMTQRMFGAGSVEVEFAAPGDEPTAVATRIVLGDVNSPDVVAAAILELADAGG